MTRDLGHKGYVGFCQTLTQGEVLQAQGKYVQRPSKY